MSDQNVKAFVFGAGRAPKQKIAGSFTVNGESFDVRVLLDSHISYLIHAVGTASESSIVVKVIDFTEKALTKESAERFEKMVLDPDAGLTTEEVIEIFQHVVSLVAAGDPTGRPNASSTSRPKSGRTSTATARSAASTQ